MLNPSLCSFLELVLCLLGKFYCQNTQHTGTNCTHPYVGDISFLCKWLETAGDSQIQWCFIPSMLMLPYSVHWWYLHSLFVAYWSKCYLFVGSGTSSAQESSSHPSSKGQQFCCFPMRHENIHCQMKPDKGRSQVFHDLGEWSGPGVNEASLRLTETNNFYLPLVCSLYEKRLTLSDTYH